MNVQYEVGHGFVLGLADWPTGAEVEDAKHRAADRVAEEISRLSDAQREHLRDHLLRAYRNLGEGSRRGAILAAHLESEVYRVLASWHNVYSGCAVSLGLAGLADEEGGK